MSMIEEVKKYGWVLAILGTVAGVAAGDLAKSGVTAATGYVSNVINPPPPPQVVLRLSDYVSNDPGETSVKVYSLQGAAEKLVHAKSWAAVPALLFDDLQLGLYYLFHLESTTARGRVQKDEAVRFTEFREIVLPPRDDPAWKPVKQATVPPPPAPSPEPAAATGAAQIRGLVKAPLDDPAWRWLAGALLELGVSEHGGDADRERIANYWAATTFPRESWSPDLPWSSAFLNAVLMRAGLPGTRSGANASWLAWGTQLDKPRPGAVAVVRLQPPGPGSPPRYFAGLLIDMQEKCALLLGGNIRDSVAVQCFQPDQVEAYRWPIL